jgi:hypothetical protein
MKTTAQWIDLPRIPDPRGNLSVLEAAKECPFPIRHSGLFYKIDVEEEIPTAGWSFPTTDVLLVALMGSFNVVVGAGEDVDQYTLNRSYTGLHLPAGSSFRLDHFSGHSMGLVLFSSPADQLTTDQLMTGQGAPAEATIQPAQNELLTSSAPSAQPAQEQIPLHTQPSVRIGSLRFIPLQPGVAFPFDLQRVFYIYDIPGGESRGAHAHRTCHQYIMAATGSFQVLLDDGFRQQTITLNRPFEGVHVPPGIWCQEYGFSSGAVCLVMLPILTTKAITFGNMTTTSDSWQPATRRLFRGLVGGATPKGALRIAPSSPDTTHCLLQPETHQRRLFG